MALDQARKIAKSLQQKQLTDLIRSVRAARPGTEQELISQAIAEIKNELRDPDRAVKTVAVSKLIFIQMQGYDISWAAFNIVEVMSATKFSGKRIGYMAASQSFHDKTDVIMLATNLLKKDFNSGNQFEAGLAINCLSNIITPDLARDLAPDVVTMLASSRPYVKKRAVLVLYKVFLKYPDSLRPSFPRLKARLTDEDPGTVSAAVNVVCELAKRNPANYLSLAPILFKILTESQNNWMLIKIVKMLASLAPVEPRLAKKLVEPLTSLMNATPAMSLLYECIQLCTVGLSQHVPMMRLCLGKLRLFIEDADQNLKYLGLVALGNIMKIHPKAVAEHRDLILACLDDVDLTIRQRALSLLNGLVSKKNLADIVRKLVEHAHAAEVVIGTGDDTLSTAAAPASVAAATPDGALANPAASPTHGYADDLIHKIVELCSMESYTHLTDFEWYISALVELTRVRGMSSGLLVADQFTNVAVRVPTVRGYAVRQLAQLLSDKRLLTGAPRVGGACEALASAAFVVGEYAAEMLHAGAGVAITPLSLCEAMLQPASTALPGHVQAHYVQAALKLFAFVASGAHRNAPGCSLADETALLASLRIRLTPFAESQHLEVQERACFSSELLTLYSELRADKNPSTIDIGAQLAALFDEAFKPVAAVAQRKVPRPDGLDLDKWLGEPIPDDTEEAFGKDGGKGGDDDYFGDLARGDDVFSSGGGGGGDGDFGFAYGGGDTANLSKEELRRMAEQRKAERAANPFMLGGGGGGGAGSGRARRDDDDDVPVVPLDKSEIGVDIEVGGEQRARPLGSMRQRQPVQIIADDELPEGALAEPTPLPSSNTVADALGAVDLSTPLRSDELLKNPTHRSATVASKDTAAAAAAARGGARGRGAPRGALRARGARGGPARGAAVARGGVAASTVPRARVAPAAGAAASSSSSSTAVGAASSVVTAASSPAAAAAAPGAVTPLAHDDVVALAYSLRTNPKEPSKIMIVWRVSTTGAGGVTNLEVTFEDNMSLTPIKATGADAPPPGRFGGAGGCAVGGEVEHKQLCKLSDVTSPLRVKGRLQYNVASTSAQRALDYTLKIAASSFVLPVKITEDEFAGLLQRPGLFASSRPVDAVDFRSFVTLLATTCHLAVVAHSSAPKTALLYGESIAQHRVCVAVRQRDNSKVCNVDIKATNKTLADSLCAEAEAMSDAKLAAAGVVAAPAAKPRTASLAPTPVAVATTPTPTPTPIAVAAPVAAATAAPAVASLVSMPLATPSSPTTTASSAAKTDLLDSFVVDDGATDGDADFFGKDDAPSKPNPLMAEDLVEL